MRTRRSRARDLGRLFFLLPMVVVCGEPANLSPYEGTSRTLLQLGCPANGEDVDVAIGAASDGSLDRSCADVTASAEQEAAAIAQSADGSVAYSSSFDLEQADSSATLAIRCIYDLASAPPVPATCGGVVTAEIDWTMSEVRQAPALITALAIRRARGAEPVTSLEVQSVSLDCPALGAPTPIPLDVPTQSPILPNDQGATSCTLSVAFASEASTPGATQHEIVVRLTTEGDCKNDLDCGGSDQCVNGRCETGASGRPCRIGYYAPLPVASDCAASAPICRFGGVCQRGRDNDRCADLTFGPSDAYCDTAAGYVCTSFGPSNYRCALPPP